MSGARKIDDEPMRAEVEYSLLFAYFSVHVICRFFSPWF
jgi:hypothetical protein